MTGNEIALLCAIGAMVAIHLARRWWTNRKIENPSPPLSGEDPDSPRELGKRRVTPTGPRGDVDHGSDEHDCTCGRCGPCQRAARVADEAEPYDPDEEYDDEPEVPRWRAWLGL